MTQEHKLTQYDLLRKYENTICLKSCVHINTTAKPFSKLLRNYIPKIYLDESLCKVLFRIIGLYKYCLTT